jgi:hypothetical protein
VIEENGLRYLMLCDASTRYPGTPSWAVNWTGEITTRASHFEFYCSIAKADASRDEEGEFHFEGQLIHADKTDIPVAPILSMKGVTVGTIAKISPAIAEAHCVDIEGGPEVWSKWLTATVELFQEANRNLTVLHSLQEIIELLSLVSDAEGHNDMLSALRGAISLTQSTSSLTKNNRPGWYPKEIVQSHFQAAGGLQIAALSCGYFANMTSNMKLGDHIVILLGCPVPLALRQVASGMYEIVGATVVSGIMNGEFIDTKPEKKWFRIV